MHKETKGSRGCQGEEERQGSRRPQGTQQLGQPSGNSGGGANGSDGGVGQRPSHRRHPVRPPPHHRPPPPSRLTGCTTSCSLFGAPRVTTSSHTRHLRCALAAAEGARIARPAGKDDGGAAADAVDSRDNDPRGRVRRRMAGWGAQGAVETANGSHIADTASSQNSSVGEAGKAQNSSHTISSEYCV